MKKRNEVFITNSFGETQRLGGKFVEKVNGQGRTLSELSEKNRGSLVIALYGDLGSGKTTFVQGIAKGLGIKRRIISPTFIIVRTYELKNQKSILRQTQDKNQNYNSKFKNLELFYHIDLYRIESVEQIEALGLDEVLKYPENIVVIEWAEKMGDLLPKERWDIRFDHLEGDRRRIVIISS